jgi:flagellar motility protein MotE (MotC chaperone)
MRRFHILPALAIFACLSMGADTRETPPKGVAPSGSSSDGKEKVTVASEPTPPPLVGGPASPDPAAIRSWCSTEQKGALELAAALRTRSAALDEQQRLLAVREDELKASEQRISDRLDDLKKLREQITQQLDSADTEKKTKVDELVKMVEANRPANIAAMFEVLDEGLAVQVLDRMNPTKAGKLLAALTPAKAARLAGKMTHPVTDQLAAADPVAAAAIAAAAAAAPTTPTTPTSPTTPSPTTPTTPTTPSPTTPAATPAAAPSSAPASKK